MLSGCARVELEGMEDREPARVSAGAKPFLVAPKIINLNKVMYAGDPKVNDLCDSGVRIQRRRRKEFICCRSKADSDLSGPVQGVTVLGSGKTGHEPAK